MSLLHKSHTRRSEIRKNRPDLSGGFWRGFRGGGALPSLSIAAGFCVLASMIVLLREEVIPYRPGQYVQNAIHSRVDFKFRDKDRLAEAVRQARENQPQIFKSNGDAWAALETELLAIPDRAAGGNLEELSQPLRDILDPAAVTAFRLYHAPDSREEYNKSVKTYVRDLKDQKLIIVPEDEMRRGELAANRLIEVPPLGKIPAKNTVSLAEEPFRKTLSRHAEQNFMLTLQPKIVELTLAMLKPTHVPDDVATAEAKNRAAERVPSTAGDIDKPANLVLVEKGKISEQDWQLLRAENEQFIAGLDKLWSNRLGLIAMVVMITIVLSAYIARYQPRIIHNHARAGAIAALLLSMLLLSQLAGIGSSSLYLFGIGPALLATMILAIAYDQRFAIGVGSTLAVLVTIGLGQGIAFFLILWVGLMTASFMLNEIRTRSKLIEVGGGSALAMIAATAAAGAVAMDPIEFISHNCLYAGAAGLSAGFVVLGILPFIEKAFRITTGMTLLEMADASQPLMRRLAVEAPGTYNHSLQVATLSESAAESIDCNSLLCRVGSYYHDIGKINKADYFVENQIDGQNRHINLSPSVSLLIIIGHVKDGIEMAREYNLPTSLFPFIQQHHGTTLVEYFYHQACTQKDQYKPEQPAISETQYRYPGPKPRSREVAIVMLADAAESSCRAMPEVNASRIESIVHDLIMRRLMDGQFEECDLTMRQLELIEKSLIKTLLGIYHGRIAYPSTTAGVTNSTTVAKIA